jgi:DNA-binding response OmpR family regulator
VTLSPASPPADGRPEPKPLILVVEDELELAKVVSQQLEEAGMMVQHCLRADHALRFLQRNFANLMLLDINLPDRSGLALLAELRQQDIAIPTIFVTGNAEEFDKVRGLELGGDDYVTKPFSTIELVARIRAVLRRTDVRDDLKVTKNVSVRDEPFPFGGAVVNPERLEITFPGDVVERLRRKELGILAHLHAHRGVVVTRRDLIHTVWGVHADVKSRSVDQYIVKVRDLYKRHGLMLDTFRTVHGVGYIFDPDNISAEGR